MSRSESRVKGSYFVTTISVMLVLVVVGALVFILLNAKNLTDHMRRNIGFVVMLKDNANEAEVRRVRKNLDTQPYTFSSVFISKEQAARDFQEEMGEDFVEVLGANPLRASIELKLNPVYANNDSLEMIAQSLQRYDVIHEIYYQKSRVQDINDNIRHISLIFLIVSAVLMLISFTLIRNTIHLAVYSRRLLIKTMQLVGATRFFIARPFLSGNMWRGFIGGLLANVLLLAGIYLVQENYANAIEVNIIHFNIIIIMIVFVVVCGMLLSLFSAWFSVNRYLNRNLDDLYA